MAVFAISGSASGLGRATRTRLEADGHRVIGIDRHEAEIVADLSRPEGREAAVAGVVEACGGDLDGFLGFAGVGSSIQPVRAIAAVNYFGSVALLRGLEPALAAGEGGVALAVSSISATVAEVDDALVEAMSADDEGRALARADDGVDGGVAYASSKLALAHWVRSVAPEWIGRGVRLNAIAPGFARTPLTEADARDPDLGPRIAALQVPIGRWAEPDDVARVATWLVGPDSAYIVGSFIVVDGGLDAAARPSLL